MSKSSGRAGSGAATVIELPVARSFRRKAKTSFYVVAFVTTLLAAVILSDYMPPVAGLLLGAVIGAAVGGMVAVLVFVWPALRILWYWSIEIGAGLLLVFGWTWLMQATTLWLSLLLVAVLVGPPMLWGWLRRRLLAVVWCVIVRHRLRLCFNAFIRTPGMYQQGSPPFILWARPTPAGERVWLWLRTGLALSDLEGRTDKIAVACWASESRVMRASRTRAALIRVDITRRDPLRATVLSPLPGMIPDGTFADDVPKGPPPQVDLNLGDVSDLTAPREPKPARIPRQPRPDTKPAEAPRPEPVDEYEAFI